MTTIILSDLHLGARNSRTDLLAPLLQGPFDQLILNGDTIDNLNFRRFRRADWQIIERLQKIAGRGELVLIRGNHDGQADEAGGFGSLDVLAQLLGTDLHEQYELPTVEGRYLVLHGDQFDRTLNLTWVGDAADWCYNQIQRVSRPTARWLKGRVKRVGGVVASVRSGALAHARQGGYAGVITGHTHYCADERIGELHYLNAGCWVDWPCTYIEIGNGQPRLRYAEESDCWSQALLRLSAVS